MYINNMDDYVLHLTNNKVSVIDLSWYPDLKLLDLTNSSHLVLENNFLPSTLE